MLLFRRDSSLSSNDSFECSLLNAELIRSNHSLTHNEIFLLITNTDAGDPLDPPRLLPPSPQLPPSPVSDVIMAFVSDPVDTDLVCTGIKCRQLLDLLRSIQCFDFFKFEIEFIKCLYLDFFSLLTFQHCCFTSISSVVFDNLRNFK